MCNPHTYAHVNAHVDRHICLRICTPFLCTQRHTLEWKWGQGTRTLLWHFMGVSPQRPLLFVVAPLSLSSLDPHSAEYRSSLWSISLTSRNPQVTLDRPWRYGYLQMSPSKANSMSQTCIKGTCSTELHDWATEHISVSCHRHPAILKDRTMSHGPPQRLKCKPPSLISTGYVLLPHLWKV